MNFIPLSIMPSSHTPIILVIPFCMLLFMIATGPVLYSKFWHNNYVKISIGLALSIFLYYVLILKNYEKMIASLAEYFQFICVIASLFIVSGTILINVNARAKPIVNVLFLLIGSVLANLIGTTGASMLLIRPYIRLNFSRIRVYHIVFFIFMVSNLGGGLTPIGDPPLFLGFLNGVPFFWTLKYNFYPWLLSLGVLAVIFYLIDSTQKLSSGDAVPFKVIIKNKANFLWLLVIILSIFLDPNVLPIVPSIRFGGHNYSFLRELIMIFVATTCYKSANREVLVANGFSFEPLKEVVLLFIGIFITMAPALDMISEFFQSGTEKAVISVKSLYWGTGFLSSLLDNAPTYLTALTASMSSYGLKIGNVRDVYKYAYGVTNPSSIKSLMSISVASVFFGAMTYIGNGPNFMVKSIAERAGLRMPSFFIYIIKYSVPILLPVLVIVYFLFFCS
jgi:Na+/H+ antiporter NhaD/arsenite permease-like protein